jgi:N-methylhydantoinase B
VPDGIAQPAEGLAANRKAVDLVLPEGTVVNTCHPATVNLYFPTAHLVYNTVLSALGAIYPARAVAPSGLGSGAVTIGYHKTRSGKPAVLYELLNTSLGGTGRTTAQPLSWR